MAFELRVGEDVIEVGEHEVHPDCAGAHTEPERRHIGTWATMGSAGQMAMGDVQLNSD